MQVVIPMKKYLYIIAAALICTVLLTSCGTKDKSDTPTEPLQTTTKVGEAVKTTQVDSAGGENVAHLTDDGLTVKMDYYDEDGDKKFTEEYIYDDYAQVIGYNYYDADGGFVARYIVSGEKQGSYYSDGSSMSDKDFTERMEKIGAVG